MDTEPHVLCDDADAVTVIADPMDARHAGKLAHGQYIVGRAYTVSAAEAQRLLTVKGFALVGDASNRKPKAKSKVKEEGEKE